ncbi:MAG: phosphatidate cytidylyltransferase [Pirellulales bacterium]
MLGPRLLAGTLIVVALAGVLYLDWRAGAAAPLLLVLAGGVLARGSWELLQLFRKRPWPLVEPVVFAAVLAVVASNWLVHIEALGGGSLGRPVGPLAWPLFALALTAMALFALQAARYRAAGQAVEVLGCELFILIYLGLLGSFVVQLRWLGGNDLGMLAFLSLVATAKGGDIGAYTTGRLVGRRPLAPRLSPNKTIEGAIGGLFGSVLGGWLVLGLAPPRLFSGMAAAPLVTTLLFGLIVGTVAQVGDLVESLVKRDLGSKDSAPLLPGLGGVLDLVDSVLYPAPVAYLFWTCGNVGPLLAAGR